MKNKGILILALLLISTLASASTITFSYNLEENKTQENPGIIYSNSLVLQIQTQERSLCRYSQSKGISFDYMTGVFDENLETIHKKTLIGMSDGVYRYFVKCRDKDDLNNISKGTAELETIFKISNPISAQVLLENEVLGAGKHEINLILTKIPITTPKLTYSYDGIIYNPIILHGAQTNWKGYLIISESLGEKIGFFKFEATDLEGRPGKNIINKNIFMVDTKIPSTITSLKATGEYGQIKLEWALPENKEVNKINIYKSENPGIGYIDYYTSTDFSSEVYIDDDVELGKTYYYKIASEDLADNIASLSKEIYATARQDNTTFITGLNPSLLGSVDAVLSELSLLESDIANAENILNNFEEADRSQLETLGLFDSVKNSKSELSALKREAENYKLQDLTSEVLNSRISSIRVKINIIKKKLPQSVTKTDSISKEQPPTDDSLRLALVEYSSELSPFLIDKSVKESHNLIKESNVKIRSEIDVFEISFLDGAVQSKSLVKHFVDSIMEKSENSAIILKLPSTISRNSLQIKNINYIEEGSGLIKFETDVKQITYIVNSKLGAEVVGEINVAPIKIAEEGLSITGYFLSEIPSSGSWKISGLIVLACSLIGYLTFMKKRQENDSISSFMEKAKAVQDLKKKGEVGRANSLYESLKIDYIALNQEEKSKVFREVKKLSEK